MGYSEIDNLLLGGSGSSYAPTDNILNDYLTKDIPTDIKGIFSLIDFIAMNSGQVVSAMRKFAEFPVTHPIFETENATIRKSHEKMAKLAKYRTNALSIGFDYHMYGNSITSVYLPINRHLICGNQKCQVKILMKDTDFKYNPKSDEFILETCPKCGYHGKVDIQDFKDTDEKKVNIVQWLLRDIDIKYNQITGQSTYYYSMPENEKRSIKDNDREILMTYPRAMLQLAGKPSTFRFKFANDFVYHMKHSSLSGISRVWGFPPPTPALRSFFYQFILKKSNQAVALDYMNHLRVIYPAASQPENNPLKYISMAVWKDEMTSTIKQWRQDKNFIKLSPHPLGYQALGGEGRGLLLTNEIREASYDILMTLGIPRELMEGSSAQNLASPVLLRIVENMMLTYMEQITEWTNWVDTKISNHLRVEPVEVSYVPFKFVDDMQFKQMVMQWGQGGATKKVSDSTIADYMELDLDKEKDKIVEEAVRDYRIQKKIDKAIQDEEASLQNQADAIVQQQQGNSVDYNNQQQTMGQAEQMASELLAVPYEQRKSQLDALMKEDFIFYSVVTQMMDRLRNAQNRSVIDASKTASVHEKIAYPNGVIPVIKKDESTEWAKKVARIQPLKNEALDE